MANSKASDAEAASSDGAEKDIEDAVVVEEDPKEDVSDESTDDTGRTTPEDEVEPVEDEAAAEDSASADQEPMVEEQTSEDVPQEEVPIEDQGEPQSAPQQTAPAEPAQPRTSFVTLLIAAAIGGLIGFGLTRIVFPPEPDPALLERVSTLEARLSDVATAAEAAASADDVSAQGLEQTAALDTVRAEMSQSLAELDARMTAMEERPPISLGTEDLREAYEAEIAALRSQFDSLAGGAEERLRIAEEAAALTEAEAAAAAAQAEADAALSQVFAAIDNGTPFANALGAAISPQGLSAPPALTDVAADGVATLGDLREAFPSVARPALSASRAALGEDEGVGGFLMTQLGVRSLEPQDGTSADAILSRVEGALADARLGDALAEIGTLPPEGQDALGDWLVQAQTRAAALDAANALRAEISGEGQN